MIKNVRTDIDSDPLPIICSRAEMSAGEDAGVLDFIESRGKNASLQRVRIHTEMRVRT